MKVEDLKTMPPLLLLLILLSLLLFLSLLFVIIVGDSVVGLLHNVFLFALFGKFMTFQRSDGH